MYDGFRVKNFTSKIFATNLTLGKIYPIRRKEKIFFYVLFVVEFIVSKFYSHIFAHVNDMPTFSFIMKEDKKLIFTKRKREKNFILFSFIIKVPITELSFLLNFKNIFFVYIKNIAYDKKIKQMKKMKI